MAEAGGSCEEAPGGSSPAALGSGLSRVQLLDAMVDTFLQKLVAAGSYQRFSSCYWRFHKQQPELTQRIHDKFISQLQTSILEEISEIKAEGNLEAVLNTLDDVVKDDSGRTEPAWRPSGLPEQDLRSTLLPCLMQQRDTLRRQVQKQEAENARLAAEVLAGRREVEQLRLQDQAHRQAWQVLSQEQKQLLAALQE